jgi:hypothetical protein
MIFFSIWHACCAWYVMGQHLASVIVPGSWLFFCQPDTGKCCAWLYPGVAALQWRFV